MNQKKIDSIACRAGLFNYVDNESPRFYFLDTHAREEDVYEFAKMIIGECIHLAKEVPLEGPAHEHSTDYEGGFWDALDLYKEHIEKHFGIK